VEQVANGSPRDLLIGTILDERYRVLRRIGRGGMGIVYLAQHVLIGRKYAIKTLSERTHATEEMVARFQREAQAAAAVGSQHVVDVTDMGRLPDGTLYIALEYLDGVELGSVVRAEGPFSIARAVHVACQLCDALAAVHEKGIVHRDLKPENLFLIEKDGASDFLKVLDFGICKLLEGSDPADAPDKPALTRTNASLGTPQYMAPEQFQTSARVDQRADIHAVGAILYFMLTGRPPFDALNVPQLYMRVCVEPPPLLTPQRPDVPQGLEGAIRRAMEKHPEDRYKSSAELKAALLPFAGIAGEAGQQLRGQTTARELPGLSTPTHAVVSPLTPAGVETSYDQSFIDVTPSLPERRWRRPGRALGLAIGVLCSLAAVSFALAPASKPRPASAAPASVAASAESRTSELSSAAEPAQLTAPVLTPPIAKAPPQAVRPRRIQTSAAPEPAPEPTERAAQLIAPVAIPPEPPARQEAVEAPYRFPRRALKSVF
jgi:serine/threonine protein kinase